MRLLCLCFVYRPLPNCFDLFSTSLWCYHPAPSTLVILNLFFCADAWDGLSTSVSYWVMSFPQVPWAHLLLTYSRHQDRRLSPGFTHLPHHSFQVHSDICRRKSQSLASSDWLLAENKPHSASGSGQFRRIPEARQTPTNCFGNKVCRNAFTTIFFSLVPTPPLTPWALIIACCMGSTVPTEPVMESGGQSDQVMFLSIAWVGYPTKYISYYIWRFLLFFHLRFILWVSPDHFLFWVDIE